MRRRFVGVVLAAAAATAGSAWLTAQGARYAGADWSAPGGDWGATRYSTLAQISTRTVKDLGGAWMAALPERADATPLVHDGRLFVVTNNGQILAFNPGTGAPLWTFKPEAGFGGRRGIGMGGGLLYAGLRDSNVIAISETTGQIVWTYRHGPDIPSQGMSSAPAYGNGVVVAVVSLGDNFLRGRAIGIDATSGTQLWSWDVVPGPGQPGHETWPQNSDIWKFGGGAIWTTPSVDESLGLVYLETGNAVPQFGGELRPGHNLYNNSVVALDIRTGAMRWHYQLVHHDIWEHDVSTPLVLYDATLDGRPRKLLAAMRTDGELFVLDRQTGQPALRVEERPVKQNPALATSPTQPFTVGAERVGPGCVDASMIPRGFVAGCYFDPIGVDQPNVYLPHMNMRQTPMAYSPDTQYLYAVSCVNPAWVRRLPTGWEFLAPVRLPEQTQYGLLAAIDSRTARIAWQKRLPYSECEGNGGALATAGGLLFHEEPDGVFQAYDARTGDLLWHFQTGEAGLGGGAGPSASAAASYVYEGRQLVALANNRAVWAFGLGGRLPERPAPAPPARVREWPATVENTTAVRLGSTRTFTIAAADKKIDWNNEDDIAPLRVRVKAGAAVTFANTTSKSHTLEARDGSWKTATIAPGASASVTIDKPGVYVYVCREHPWSIAQLTAE